MTPDALRDQGLALAQTLQLRVMERYCVCGILHSGAYQMELPTTVTTREVDAPHFLLGQGGHAGCDAGQDRR
jgi:hypothetical protein